MQFGVVIGTFAIAYLLGSIPFGLLLTRFFGGVDIRSIGSGNIGATNVMRTGKKWLGVLTLLLDLGKGLVAVLFAKYVYDENAAIIAGLFAVLGHVFPIWLQYKGGKGVATSFGVFLAINWSFALVILAVWVGVFLITRFSSLAAIVSICFSSVIAYVMDGYMAAMLCLILSALIIFTHRQNLARLLSRTEHSFKGGAL
jgi:glycerol-3-phosphate acyltransferase PlsY